MIKVSQYECYLLNMRIIRCSINYDTIINVTLQVKPALFAPRGISRNTVLKYLVTYKNPTSALYCACVLSGEMLSYLLVFIIANLLYLKWLNFMYFLPSLSAISIANRGAGGWVVRRGGLRQGRMGVMGGGKNHCLGHPMSSHDAHTVANDTLVSHIVNGSKPRSPLPN